MASEDIRLYSFHVPGYIPGIARIFAGGSQAYVDEVTLEVVAEGPMGQKLVLPDSLDISRSTVAPAVEVPTTDSGEAASSLLRFLSEPAINVGG